jgi:AcrB/AcrD/AcrF family
MIMRFTASLVPVIQLALSSTQANERQIDGYAQYRIRQPLTTVPGSTLPSPYGGVPQQIMVDLDLPAIAAYALSPLDVTNAIDAQNLTIPSRVAKFGKTQYVIRVNTTPEAIATMNQLPAKPVNGSPILLSDVANARDRGPPQQNLVRQDGHRAVLLTILTNGNASPHSVANTMTVEVDLPDPQHRLRAGLYVNVTLDIPRVTPTMVGPVETLVFENNTVHVFVVGIVGRVTSRTVSVARLLRRRVRNPTRAQWRRGAGTNADRGLASGAAIKIEPRPSPSTRSLSIADARLRWVAHRTSSTKHMPASSGQTNLSQEGGNHVGGRIHLPSRQSRGFQGGVHG